MKRKLKQLAEQIKAIGAPCPAHIADRARRLPLGTRFSLLPDSRHPVPLEELAGPCGSVYVRTELGLLAEQTNGRTH